MSEENQYQTPNSNVEQSSNTEYGEVKLLAVGGRIGRIRYMAYNFGLFIALFAFVMLATFAMGLGSNSGEMGIASIIMMLIMFVVYITFFVITIMLTIQRAHDFNSSGWLCLITFIPVASLIFLFIPGTDGENQYGLKTPPNGAATVVVIVMFLIIPIMGILAAIAIPAYQGYVEKAQQLQLEQTK